MRLPFYYVFVFTAYLNVSYRNDDSFRMAVSCPCCVKVSCHGFLVKCEMHTVDSDIINHKVSSVDKVLVTVVTDGYENASVEYKGKDIKALIDELKGMGWVFVYVGANQDVEAVAATISIENKMCFSCTPKGTVHMTQAVNSGRERWYQRIANACTSQSDNKNFFDNDDK